MSGRRRHSSETTKPSGDVMLQDRSESAQSESALCHFLLQVVDVGMAGVIFFAPLFMGGRHPMGQWVFVSIVCVTAVAWAARQRCLAKARWVWSGAELLILAGIVLIGLQLLPVSQSWLGWLSPSMTASLPLWSAEGDRLVHLGQWTQVSVSPEATRGGGVMFMAYAMLFLVAVQRIRKLDDIERLLRWLAIAIVGMAVLGLVQYLMSNGKFLWVYEHPSRDTRDAVNGSFANKNHFAHFLALGIGPLIWWMQSVLGHRAGKQASGAFMVDSHSDRDQLARIAFAVALGLLAFAGLLSFSRGGIIVMALATTACVVIYARTSVLSRKSLLTLVVVGSVVVAALSIHGHRRLTKRFNTMSAGSMEQLDHSGARRKIWSANLTAVPHFAVLGAGIGSHRHVYPMFFEDYANVEYTHAENGYLQVLLEAGIPGLMLLLAGAGLCGFWCFGALRNCGGGHEPPRRQTRRIAACTGAVVAGLLASMVHSLIDFVWYIPACISLTLILAACALHLYRLSKDNSSQVGSISLSPRVWSTITVLLFMVGAAMIANRTGPAMAARHWERYLSMSLASNEFAERGRLGGLSERLGAVDGSSEEAMAAMTASLDSVLRSNPLDGRAHLRMAAVSLRRFHVAQQNAENAMALVHIRDAALASNFPSREAQDRWLSLAVGENRRYLDAALRHTRRGLQLSPFQGEGYLYLAELGFLQGWRHGTNQACIQQALTVRPHSGAVLFAAGREAAVDGDVGRLTALWKKAFHRGPEFQAMIVELLASDPRTAAEDILLAFEPELDSMRRLFRHFSQADQDNVARYVGRYYGRLAEEQAQIETGTVAAKSWFEAHKVHRFLGDAASALAAAEMAVQLEPNDFDMRFALAMALFGQEKYPPAIEHFRWCRQRKPDDQRSQTMLRAVVRRNIEHMRNRRTSAEVDSGTSVR